jgi:hypothetical protein
MPFYLRKSVSVGPFRFNLSKSGMGVSAGVTGFRVGTGPRGSYVHVGRGGLYYRTSLNPAGRSEPRRRPPTFGPPAPEPAMQEVETGDVMQMVDADASQILGQINEKLASVPISPFMACLGIVAVGVVWHQNPTAGQYVGLIALLTLALTLFALWRDSIRLKVVLLYDLDDAAAAAFERLTSALDAIQSAARLWNIDAHAATNDWKRNAGATSILERQIARIEYTTPRVIETNVSVPAVVGGRQRLYFFPDLLLVMEGRRAGGIKYSELLVDSGHVRFTESGAVPADATIVDHTWRYVNKDGGPDRRFIGNRQLPVCIYQTVWFHGSSGLKKILHISRSGDEGQRLRQAVAQMARTVETGFHVTTRKDTTMPVWTNADTDALIRNTRHTVDSLKGPLFDAFHDRAEQMLTHAIMIVAFKFLSGATIGENEAVLLHALLKEFHYPGVGEEDESAASLRTQFQELIRYPAIKKMMTTFDQLPDFIFILERHDQQRGTTFAERARSMLLGIANAMAKADGQSPRKNKSGSKNVRRYCGHRGFRP